MEKLIRNACQQRLELEYPCRWVYKLIGVTQEEIRGAVRAVLQDRECLITFSNVSKTGRYHCLNVELIVHSEDDRTANYEAFKRHPSITMVL
ncbi:HP0495 family protein [Thiovibrio sp. JS02]